MSDVTQAGSPVYPGTTNSNRDPVNADALSLSYVDCAAIRYFRIHREQIRAHDIAHMRKITSLLAVSIYRQHLSGTSCLKKALITLRYAPSVAMRGPNTLKYRSVSVSIP